MGDGRGRGGGKPSPQKTIHHNQVDKPLGTLLLIRSLFRLAPAYRGQAGGLLIGISAPWVGNALYLGGLSPFPYLDLTPFALLISGIALAWDLLHFGLLELVPIAHSTVFQSMDDGVIVLDREARIVDINPVALALISRSLPEVLGQPAQCIFANWADILRCYSQISEAHEELVLQVDNNERFFDLRIPPNRGYAWLTVAQTAAGAYSLTRSATHVLCTLSIQILAFRVGSG
jgi:PAS domain-containing protein